MTNRFAPAQRAQQLPAVQGTRTAALQKQNQQTKRQAKQQYTLKNSTYCLKNNHAQRGKDTKSQAAKTLSKKSIYSQTQPTEAGSFWHYDTDGNPVMW